MKLALCHIVHGVECVARFQLFLRFVLGYYVVCLFSFLFKICFCFYLCVCVCLCVMCVCMFVIVVWCGGLLHLLLLVEQCCQVVLFCFVRFMIVQVGLSCTFWGPDYYKVMFVVLRRMNQFGLGVFFMRVRNDGLGGQGGVCVLCFDFCVGLKC